MKLYCKKQLPTRSKKAFIQAYMDAGMPETFTSKECLREDIQCQRFKNRSYDDVKALLDGQFKTKTSLNRTIKLLIELIDEKKIKCLICIDVKKLVFFSKNKGHWTFKIGKDINHGKYKSKKYLENQLNFNECVEVYKGTKTIRSRK